MITPLIEAPGAIVRFHRSLADRYRAWMADTDSDARSGIVTGPGSTVDVPGGGRMVSDSARRARWRRYWDKHSTTYDREMRFLDRTLFGDTRNWICRQARGEVLEVAIGTGLNLEHYPADVALTGIELSPDMLAIARRRADDLDRPVDLRVGDAEALGIASATFDTVVCTFSLCAIPDHQKALAEMARVLRPGGVLLLADHVASSAPVLRAGQRVLELVTVPLGGEHFSRRPIVHVRATGFRIERHDRFAAGIVERLAARKPAILMQHTGRHCR
jgi:ubiquinone/menaquinone biosynthesis C-methylase UbiE